MNLVLSSMKMQHLTNNSHCAIANVITKTCLCIINIKLSVPWYNQWEAVEAWRIHSIIHRSAYPDDWLQSIHLIIFKVCMPWGWIRVHLSHQFSHTYTLRIGYRVKHHYICCGCCSCRRFWCGGMCTPSILSCHQV